MAIKKTIFVVFGATGDLMKKKLVPAFVCLSSERLENSNFEVLGVGRKILSEEEFRTQIKHGFSSKSKCDILGLEDKFSYLGDFDYDTVQSFLRLKDLLYKKLSNGGEVIFYASVPPSVFPKLLLGFENSGLNVQDSIIKKIAFEKPFGENLASAKKLNLELKRIFSEEFVYRIDHYLGKDSVQNFLVLRFANLFLEALWNNQFIDNVQITASESIGVENRGEYYDNAGALRDMVQNHLFQMLSLIAMEPPKSLNGESIRDEKVRVFSAIKPLESNWTKSVVFGQYKGYLDEVGVAKSSRTETYVAMKVAIENSRWTGVPFYLRTGKKMKEKGTLVVVEFKKLDNVVFGGKNLESNKLVIRISPDEKISLKFNSSNPEKKVGVVDAIFNSSEFFGKDVPQAYERILVSIMNGDKTLFSRYDEVEKSWEIVDKLVLCHDNCPIVYKYDAGGFGPEMSEKLLEQDGKNWWNF